MDISTTFTVSTNLMGKLFRYGSLRAATGASSLCLTYVSHPENLIELITRESDPHKNAFQKKPDVERLLTENEHDKLEFKSSLRFDYKTLQASRDVEKAAMKTIAAFLNSKGGHLVLGVNDSLVTVGIENDYQTLQRKDADGFENHFTQAFNSMIGPEFRNFIKLWFHKLDGHDLCVVQVLASPRPVYLKTDNNEQFYMRTGNISTALKLSEIDRIPAPAGHGTCTKIRSWRCHFTVPEARFSQPLRAIRNSKKEVLIGLYTFRADRTGREFMELLAARARQGVRIRVIFDAFGSRGHELKVLKKLRDAGTEARIFHPLPGLLLSHPLAFLCRNHARIFLF